MKIGLSARNLRTVLVTIVVLIVVGLGWTLFHFRQQQRNYSQWVQRVEKHGARVVIAGYGGPLARIPILGELTMNTQVEVFLPSNKTANAVLEILRENSDVKRLWIHKLNVDQNTVDRLTAAVKNADVVFYTP